MIKVEKIEIAGLEPAIRGMRNPMNSWDRSDSGYKLDEEKECIVYQIGSNDLDLMQRLYRAGSEHRKYMRMVMVWMDITAPRYWWPEFDTYKVGTVSNSCSTMHKLTSKPITEDDFALDDVCDDWDLCATIGDYIDFCDNLRKKYNETGDKRYWNTLIKALPQSYLQKRTVMFSYENAIKMIRERENHKLNEWRIFVQVLKDLPYIKEIMEIE